MTSMLFEGIRRHPDLHPLRFSRLGYPLVPLVGTASFGPSMGSTREPMHPLASVNPTLQSVRGPQFRSYDAIPDLARKDYQLTRAGHALPALDRKQNLRAFLRTEGLARCRDRLQEGRGTAVSSDGRQKRKAPPRNLAGTTLPGSEVAPHSISIGPSFTKAPRAIAIDR